MKLANTLVVLALAAIPFLDWVLPFPMPDSVGERKSIVEGPAVGAGEGRGGGLDSIASTAAERTGTERSGGHGDIGVSDNSRLLQAVSDAVERLALDSDAPVIRRVGVRRDAEAVTGEMTYYHPSLEWDGKCCLMADGATPYYRDQSGIVAATVYPIGSLLSVCGPTGRCLQLEVRDRGLLGVNPPHLDLSERDFMVLGGRLEYGVITATIRVLYVERQPIGPFVGHNFVDGGGH